MKYKIEGVLLTEEMACATVLHKAGLIKRGTIDESEAFYDKLESCEACPEKERCPVDIAWA